MARRSNAALARSQPPGGGGAGGGGAGSSGSGIKAHSSGDATPVELDRLIHERMRLGIVSALAVNPSLSFSELKALMRTTDGNLSVHARKLEEAGYVTCTKSFEGRVPKTTAGRSDQERMGDA